MGTKQLAVVTGASSGFGLEIAKAVARGGRDLFVAADEDRIESAAETLRALGAQVTSAQADFATISGVHEVYEEIAAAGRPVDILIANAGLRVSGAFLDQDIEDWRRMVDTNIVGTLYLAQRIGADMRARGGGRILIAGATARAEAGASTAVWNGSSVFLESFARDLRRELASSNITVTWLGSAPAPDLGAPARGADNVAVPSPMERFAGLAFEALMKGEAVVATPPPDVAVARPVSPLSTTALKA